MRVVFRRLGNLFESSWLWHKETTHILVSQVLAEVRVWTEVIVITSVLMVSFFRSCSMSLSPLLAGRTYSVFIPWSLTSDECCKLCRPSERVFFEFYTSVEDTPSEYDEIHHPLLWFSDQWQTLITWHNTLSPQWRTLIEIYTKYIMTGSPQPLLCNRWFRQGLCQGQHLK